jgi:hypothetical protein
LTEANRRRVNEAIERGHDARSVVSFVCECGRIGCTDTVALAHDHYEGVRTSFERFLVAPGHELPDVEDVVERHEHHRVVAKTGVGAEVAEETERRR